MHKIVVLFAAVVVSTLAEPPVTGYGRGPAQPNSQYGIPSKTASQYNPRIPSTAQNRNGYDSSSGFANAYGAPNANGNGYASANGNGNGYASGNGNGFGSGNGNGYGNGNGNGYGNGNGNGYGNGNGNGYGNGNGNGYGNGNGNGNGYGNGNTEDPLSEPASYEFSYEVDAPEYGVQFGHRESREGDDTSGLYHVLLPDGRTQIVEYEADEGGYRPVITYQDSNQVGGNGNGNGNGNGPNGLNGANGGYNGNGANGGYGSSGLNGANGGYNGNSGYGNNGLNGGTGGYESGSNGFGRRFTAFPSAGNGYSKGGSSGGYGNQLDGASGYAAFRNNQLGSNSQDDSGY